jgi:succinoglycan biosynthesis transport protein ExoP
MNAPNFNFEDWPKNLPSLAGGARALAPESNGPPVKGGDAYGSEESGSDYRRLFFMFLGLALKYRWLILGCTLIALVLGLIVTFTATPIYRATTVIQIEREAPKVVKIDFPTQERSTDVFRFYQTQYDLLKSHSLAERVAANLDLGAASDFLSPPSTSPWSKLRNLIWPRTTSDKRNFEQKKAAAAGRVQGGLTVTPVLNSSLVRISFDSPSPVWAKRIADGVADSFISSNLDRRYGATAYARNFLKERLEEIKLKLEESEKALVAYSEKKKIFTSQDGKQSLADADVTAANEALQKSVSERIAAQQLWDQANQTRGMALPQVLADGGIQALRTKRASLMADYQERLSKFKPAYPDMLRLKAQIDQIDHEVNSAVSVIKQSLKARYESAVEQENLLRKQVDEVKRGLLDARNKEIQYNILKREADTNRTLYNGLLQQFKDVGVAGAIDTNNISVIDRAQLPGAPFKPNLKKNLMIAFVLGLIGAALAIVVFEVLDDTFKSPEEVEDQLGMAVLGIIPFTDGDVLNDVIGSPSSPLAEAFRSFRTALQFSTDQGTPKSILVTSARPGEGKSTTALALAINFAQLGMKVLLIDADLRNPSQHRNLKRDNGVGLANYLAGAGAPSAGIFQETHINGLYFIASGPLPPNPAELLAGSKMYSLLSAAGEKFDTVVIDSPPVMGLADSPLLSSIAAGTLLVMATRDTRRGVVKAALKRLHFARARMVGVVMNKFDFRTASARTLRLRDQACRASVSGRTLASGVANDGSAHHRFGPRSGAHAGADALFRDAAGSL